MYSDRVTLIYTAVSKREKQTAERVRDALDVLSFSIW